MLFETFRDIHHVHDTGTRAQLEVISFCSSPSAWPQQCSSQDGLNEVYYCHFWSILPRFVKFWPSVNAEPHHVGDEILFISSPKHYALEKRDSIFIIYTCSCQSKALCFILFCRSQKEMFRSISTLLFSLQRKQMVRRGCQAPKSTIKVTP